MNSDKKTNQSDHFSDRDIDLLARVYKEPIPTKQLEKVYGLLEREAERLNSQELRRGHRRGRSP